MRINHHLRLGLITLTATLISSGIAPAQDIFTAVSGNWSLDSNWQDGTAPVSGDTTYLSFNWSSGSSATNDAGGAFILNRMDVDFPFAGSSSMNINESGGSSLTFDGINPSVNITGNFSGFDLNLNQAVLLNETLEVTSTSSGGRLSVDSISGNGGLNVDSGGVILQEIIMPLTREIRSLRRGQH